jgi:predicted enzyme related to lactoylglutathione lyase
VPGEEEDVLMAGRVVHYMVAADDVGAMATFYGEVFGWRVAPRAMKSVDADVSGTYTFVEAEDGGIAGGFTRSGDVGERGVVLVVEVDDLEETIGRAERLGFAGDVRTACPSGWRWPERTAR